MNVTSRIAILSLAAAGLLASPGCDKSRDEMRPSLDSVSTENGLQSRDLREMTDKMAPDLLTIPEIVNNPTRITIVCKGVRNGLEGEETRNIDIYVARLAGLLNSHASRDRVAFVEENAVVGRMAAEELGNRDPFETASRNPNAQDPSITPQFALYGEFRSIRRRKDTYYLCQFKLTNLMTRQIVWTGQYEVKTLNVR
jgi:hypothetical protein